jgi:catechol 2,3-dioxygenase-like lactoylglutathione lyase family enzyme
VKLLTSYPIVVTDRVRDCRDFYVEWFGLDVVFEAGWIAVLGTGGTPVAAFMHTAHPSAPPEPGAYEGDGAFLTLQVADGRAEFERVSAAGLRCDLELTDEPWGQRRFGVVDPAGMWVDVVEQIEPAPGWWERHGMLA